MQGGMRKGTGINMARPWQALVNTVLFKAACAALEPQGV